MADDNSSDETKKKTAKKKKAQLKRQTKRRITSNQDRVTALVLAVERFLRRELTPILEGLRSEEVTATEAAKALGGLESAVEEAGLAEYFERTRAIFQDELEAVRDEFEQTADKAAVVTRITQSNVNAFVDARLELAATYITDYLGDVRSVVMDAVIGGRKVDPAKVLELAEGRTLANLRTEIDTTLLAYQRIMHQETAKRAGITKFLYVGPDDEITRPFCAERVDKVFTQEEIDEWDATDANGQGLPASVYCGGYNCRHHLRPISDDLAAELTEADELEDGEQGDD